MKRLTHFGLLVLFIIGAGAAIAQPQPDLQEYSISTPRPINPAASTTNPSALATQSQNPYLGSTPAGKAKDETIPLSLREAVERGLRYNLGLIESTQGNAELRAQRVRALSALLPQLSIGGEQAFENLSLKEIGLKLPPGPGVPRLPTTTGAFGYQDARVSLAQSVYSSVLHNRYREQRSAEKASVLSTRDARDVVVYAVGIAYLQVSASVARVETARAQLASAKELDQQTEDQVKNETSPEIDSIRAQVELQTAEQRFALSDSAGYRALEGLTEPNATEEALQTRSDLHSAEENARAAEYGVRAARGQRYPVLALNANYGGAGTNVGSFDSVYGVFGSVWIPILTGGRIRVDIAEAQANLARRRAECEDLKGRVAYDVRVAWLDLQASDSGMKVADKNKALAERALAQSRDRYANGVTNYLEVLEAQQTLTAAEENYIQSLYSFNVSKMTLARAMGVADKRFSEFFGGK